METRDQKSHLAVPRSVLIGVLRTIAAGGIALTVAGIWTLHTAGGLIAAGVATVAACVMVAEKNF